MINSSWIIFGIIIYFFGNIHSLNSINNLNTIFFCKNQRIKFNYNPLLLSSLETKSEYTYIKDTGTWNPCQVALVVPLKIKYFLTGTLTKANCAQATFNNLRMQGNAVIGISLSKVFNFTVEFNDSNNPRSLETPQVFKGTAGVATDIPNIISAAGNRLLTADLTLTFNGTNHKKDDCGQITNEEVIFDLYVHV